MADELKPIRSPAPPLAPKTSTQQQGKKDKKLNNSPQQKKEPTKQKQGLFDEYV